MMVSPSQWPLMRVFTRWLCAADNAAEGILHAAKTQPHLRFQLLAGGAVLLGGFVVGLEKLEFAAVALITIVVIVAELFNSALEAAVDLASPAFKPLARTAKDIAAGAVLISAVGAVVIGYMIIGPHLLRIWRGLYRVPRHAAGNIAVLALILVLQAVIFIKAYSGSGHPLRGGFPSGHTAAAFSFWISLIHMTSSPWLIGPGLLAALLVAACRLRLRVHTLGDVFFGALLGSSLTWVLFKVFWH